MTRNHRRNGASPFVLTWLEQAAFSGFLLLAIVFGGSSASNVAGNAMIQITAVVGMAAVLTTAKGTPTTAERHLLLLAGLLGTLFVMQLVPLPPLLWHTLPGRTFVDRGFAALGLVQPWMPLSLTPARTLSSGLALLIPVAAVLMSSRLSRAAVTFGTITVLAAALVAMLIGVAQVAGQQNLYFYANTNADSAVGFFANANHFATLMCVAMPLAAGAVARVLKRRGAAGGASRSLGLGILLGTILLALLGITMSRSVAGLLLAILAVAGSVMIVLSSLSRKVRKPFVGGVALVIVVAVVVAVLNADSDLLSLQLGASGLSRPGIWRLTIEAIGQFGVAGSGFGSFQQVFHLFENPDQVGLQFANHAHNDLLEFVLEGGVPALALLVAFSAWFGMRFFAIWQREQSGDPARQAASIAALIIILHSLVDYPLRTAAMSAVFGLCLGLMARREDREGETSSVEGPAGRHLSA